LEEIMSIRRAQTSDARGIAEAQVAAWQTAYRGLLPDELLDTLSVSGFENRWRLRLTFEDSRQTLVYEQDGHILGFVAFGPCRDEDIPALHIGEIYAIYLHPVHWRQGYGSSLMEAALLALRKGGYTQVSLWVLRNNQPARRFYEAAGFRTDGAIKEERRDAGIEMHEVRYRRPIEEERPDGQRGV
jgi:ribosomal protein S18 acetylase RimI-like enzyme